MTINRVKVIETVVCMMLDSLPDERRQAGYIHIMRAEQAAVLIARRRALDMQLAAVCALLHDYEKYRTGESEDHAKKSADAALPILAKTELFTPCEIGVIAGAIMVHSDKESVGQPYEEVIKDADVLAHHFLKSAEQVKEEYPRAYQRYLRLKEEFSI